MSALLDRDIILRASGIDLVALAQKFGAKLSRRGRDWAGPCPRCGGRDRFVITPRKGVFLCRQCGAGGDAIELLRFLTSCSFQEAIERLTAWPRARTRGDAKQNEDANTRRLRIARFCGRTRQPAEGTIVETYLRRRGYDGAIPPSIGFLPSGKYPPAMVAAFGPARRTRARRANGTASAIHPCRASDEPQGRR
jgi:hypothetical protein